MQIFKMLVDLTVRYTMYAIKKSYYFVTLFLGNKHMSTHFKQGTNVRPKSNLVNQ